MALLEARFYKRFDHKAISLRLFTVLSTWFLYHPSSFVKRGLQSSQIAFKNLLANDYNGIL